MREQIDSSGVNNSEFNNGLTAIQKEIDKFILTSKQEQKNHRNNGQDEYDSSSFQQKKICMVIDSIKRYFLLVMEWR